MVSIKKETRFLAGSPGLVRLLWFYVQGKATTKPLVNMAVPPGVVADTSLGPIRASAAMVILAVIWVGLSTVKLLIVTFAPKLTIVAPVRSVPVIITFNVWLWLPELGTMPVIAGAGMDDTTVKPLLRVAVPPGVVTDTFLAPGTAAAAIVILEVICVPLLTV
jgi:hypothetical protein